MRAEHGERFPRRRSSFLLRLQKPQVAERERKKSYVEKVKHRMLRAADIHIYRKPFLEYGAQERTLHCRLSLVVCRPQKVSQVIPRGIKEGVRHVGFPAGLAAALRALHFVKRFYGCQGRHPRSRGTEVFYERQLHRQISLRDCNPSGILNFASSKFWVLGSCPSGRRVGFRVFRSLLTCLTKNERNGRPPIPLTRNKPVPETVLRHAPSAYGFGDFPFRLLAFGAIKFTRTNKVS